MKGAPLGSQPDCYYRMKEHHPALGEYAPGAIIEGDGQIVPVAAMEGSTVLAECWNLGTGDVRGPAIIANAFGKGRTIYISGSLEANYLTDRVKSTARVLTAMVQYLGGGEPQPFRMKAPKGVFGVLRRATTGDLALRILANVGFKDAASGRMRQEYLPVTNVEIAIRVPEGHEVKSVRLMRAGQDVPFRVEAGYVVATIPQVHIAEVVHLGVR